MKISKKIQNEPFSEKSDLARFWRVRFLPIILRRFEITLLERIEWNVLLVNIFARRASSLGERRTLNYKWIVIKTT